MTFQLRLRARLAGWAGPMACVLVFFASAWPAAAEEFVRTRVILVSRAPLTVFDLDGAMVTNLTGALLEGPAGSQVSVSGTTVSLLNTVPTRAAEAVIDLVLAEVSEASSVTWAVHAAVPLRASLEVYNTNEASLPRLVDRFEAARGQGRYVTSGALLRDGGPLTAGEVPSRLVLAHYYPWYDRATWQSAWLADRPAALYSTDDVEDVTRVFSEARAAGLDGLVVSWQGKDFEGGWNHRRMLVALDAAHRVGLHASVLLETTVANPEHQQVDTPVDPVTMLGWLRDVLSLYASHPAFLRVEGRPVIFVYSVNRLKPGVWAAIVDALSAEGHSPLLVGDNTKSSWLDAFAGQFDYASNRFSPEEAATFDRQQGLRVRSFHLLPGKGARRIWAATVSPGYDDTALQDGRTPRVTDRAGGQYYDAQWRAAIESGADWVLVTSWNEWWENTEIEPSQRYGDVYVQRTRAWADAFHASVPSRAPAAGDGPHEGRAPDLP